MTETIIAMIRDAYSEVPTPYDRVGDLLAQLLDQCGLSPYNGENELISELIESTGIRIDKIEHKTEYTFDVFGSERSLGLAWETHVYFSIWYDGYRWGQAVLEYYWDQ